MLLIASDSSPRDLFGGVSVGLYITGLVTVLSVAETIRQKEALLAGNLGIGLRALALTSLGTILVLEAALTGARWVTIHFW